MTQDELRAALDYDPATGVFTWARDYGKAKAGKVAGSKNRGGYVSITVSGYRAYAHRLAFLWMEGAMPDLVDHIDQNPSNNAWGNLRPASKSMNAVNSKRNARNRSGLRGVSWHSGGSKWQAHFGPHYLGLFQTKEAAHAAYLSAAGDYSCSAM